MTVMSMPSLSKWTPTLSTIDRDLNSSRSVGNVSISKEKSKTITAV